MAGDFLRADPTENTFLLTVADDLRSSGASGLFGWWTPAGGRIGGAFLHVRPHPALLTAMPEPAAADLAGILLKRGPRPAAILAEDATARAFADAWRRRTGEAGEVRMRQRLFRLDRLDPPDPPPPGAQRLATPADEDLLLAWNVAFARDLGKDEEGSPAFVRERMERGGFLLWEADGAAVSLAGRTPVVAGMARIGPVYTPPEHRRRGYGAAVTAALSRHAQEAGARDVVLFTDLANPTSNAIYQRLGYRPISDRLVLTFP